MITEKPRLRISDREIDGTFHLVQARNLGHRYDVDNVVPVEDGTNYLSLRIKSVLDGGRLKPVVYRAELENQGVN